MIKIPKKPLYNSQILTFLRKHPSLKIAFNTILFSFFYIFLPIYYISKIKANLKILFIFYLFNITIAYYLINKFFKNKSCIALEIQELQEKINTETDQIEKEKRIESALGFKINRYNSLQNIIQQINNTFDLASIADYLVNIAFGQIAQGKGVCLLYLVDRANQRLNLCTTKSEDPNLIIKAKEGDIFDNWVLRHTSTLLIEDIAKDFRFDIDKIDKEYKRAISSLICSPLVSQETMLAIIRIDNPMAHYFSQDDLRLLNTLSDLGAVALENSELFQRTQELAIKDDLTGLFRKGYFWERLKEEFQRSMRQKKELSLLMIDIDYFKDYNDKFGHTAGDIVLKEIASIIIRSFQTPLLCRFGGEEFCVLLPEVKKKSASTLAEQFCKRIQDKEIILRRQKTNITVSIGLATYPQDASSDDELLHKSDAALYRAKEGGRNRVCLA